MHFDFLNTKLVWVGLKLLQPLPGSGLPLPLLYALRVSLLRNASAIALEQWQWDAVVTLDNQKARVVFILPLARRVTVSKAVDLRALVS